MGIVVVLINAMVIILKRIIVRENVLIVDGVDVYVLIHFIVVVTKYVVVINLFVSEKNMSDYI
jgi:hypothetical protein